MRRIIIAILVGGSVATAVFGSAASITNTVPKLGGGSATVASCDSAVTTAWDSAYDSTIPGYAVTTVTVSGIASPACEGATLKVTLADVSNAALGSEKTGTMATSETSKALDFSADHISTGDVVKVNTVLVGP